MDYCLLLKHKEGVFNKLRIVFGSLILQQRYPEDTTSYELNNVLNSFYLGQDGFGIAAS